ncbi:juvenile hormone acid O-methyltransferase-like [Bactrocera neohumeralis]|uniref:juvenile hormone acid O-methyltransferase-like n=1 Tax=Bactrocera neohumeralis TaxID=98809 RepID=UPI0021656C41|nr:juvenile hormone acid O-methyltransferase-like [Bactrocera neohumeralis]
MNQPNKYAATNATQIRNILELIGQFSEEFRNMNGRIIDIGCGPGNTTRDILVPCVGREAVIVGADISPEMIEYAKQHYAVDDKLSFIELDMQTSELPKNLIEQFDHAVSFYALHWCKNTLKALQNIYKLLRPGGKAIILTISHHMIYDMYPEQEKDPRFAPYMQVIFISIRFLNLSHFSMDFTFSKNKTFVLRTRPTYRKIFHENVFLLL